MLSARKQNTSNVSNKKMKRTVKTNTKRINWGKTNQSLNHKNVDNKNKIITLKRWNALQGAKIRIIWGYSTGAGRRVSTESGHSTRLRSSTSSHEQNHLFFCDSCPLALPFLLFWMSLKTKVISIYEW